MRNSDWSSDVCSSDLLTAYNQAGALVHIYRDGSIHLNHGGTEMGQGLYTKVAQVVAQAFQFDIDRVRISATSTGKVPNTPATAASSRSDINGMAAHAACNTTPGRLQIGSASCRETVFKYASLSVVAVSCKKYNKSNKHRITTE